MSRDYSNATLRDRSFKNEDLKNANFCNADIRDVDFTNADLTDARFNEAKINGVNFCGANLTNARFDNAVYGLKTWWTIFLAIFSFLIFSLSAFAGSIIISCNFYFYSRTRSIKPVITLLISVIYITILQGHILTHIQNSPIGYIRYTAISAVLIVGVFVPFLVTLDEPRSKSYSKLLLVMVSSLGLIILTIFLLTVKPFNPEIIRAIGAIYGGILGIYISYQAIIIKDKKYVWLWNFFVYLASIQGTKFYHCNLENTSFFQVNLKGSHFSECIVKKTNWQKVKKTDCSRIQANYFEEDSTTPYSEQ
ncbi:pentapeptide repeat-containing protein [Brasilonema sp. CT11]|nr:pentapeptide repeat-containing protein [Brasilonema sp. CT11]